MLKKPRLVPYDLIILRSLNARMDLTEKDKKAYLYKEKGFEGEVMFDKLTVELNNDCYILNDLLFELNNTEFQIDSSIVFQDTLKFFEVKNYEGDFYFKSGRFYIKNGDEIKNALNQLERTESLFRQLLHSIGYKISVEGYVVFINPEFSLYQAPLDKPIILPTQLNRLIRNLNMTPTKLDKRHTRLSDELIALHKPKSRYTLVPHYEYGQLKKGFVCGTCHSLSVSVEGNKLVCGICREQEDLDSAIIRSVDELRMLFPDLKITTSLIQEWCKVIESKKMITRVLKKHFNMTGYGRWTFFE
ncbi:nuclease-related domain-containing protein [Neobacillus niacini]|uniref:nuclease-related domain-containing protein n=1 Tax=Neobacillus niacini TaxID=86668 RepID=UPI00285E3738|nr:nuclease-related domain-containing protein [Neobacillus niacini]MDR7001843.1 hypothetical protein [Neobacillus niacini]